MHIDEILAPLRRQPFVPFRLHAADGASFDIRHPELLFVSTRSAYVGLPLEPPQLVADRVVTIALGHISRLEELPIPTPPGNGQQNG
jgi:hypothetical protein